MSHFFKPLVKHSHIREILARKISERCTVGDKLPTENELAAQYSVSRQTIRHALAHLEQAGLIERKRGRGTFVKQVPDTKQTKRLTGSVGDEPDHTIATVISKGFVTAPLYATWLGKSVNEVWHVRRLRLYEGMPLAVHDAYVADRLIAVVESLDLTASSLHREMENFLNYELERVERQIDAIAADSSISHLLKIPIGMPILQLKTFYLGHGKPAVLFNSLYRTDRYYYSVTRDTKRLSKVEQG